MAAACGFFSEAMLLKKNGFAGPAEVSKQLFLLLEFRKTAASIGTRDAPFADSTPRREGTARTLLAPAARECHGWRSIHNAERVF
jgi:hypothetical protein